MANYYFLAASLPPLELGSAPQFSFAELVEMLELNLSEVDFAKTVVLRRLVDLYNIRSLFLEEPIDPRGNLNEKELDEALLQRVELPEYVFDFLDRYESAPARIKNFSHLLASFFRDEMTAQKGFLKRYLKMERDWRLVLLALRAKQLGRDVSHELQFEDFSDPLVAHILAQKDSEQYEPPVGYLELKELYFSCISDPLEQHQVFGTYRFDKIEELVEKPLFSIDWILGYMAQLMIVEHWNELDEKKGKMILETFKTS